MPRILYVTSELPYFPGQGGVMALHMRYLANAHFVGIVGPRYPHQPEDALQRLRENVQRSYWWPENPGDTPFYRSSVSPGAGILNTLPRGLKFWILRRLTGLHRHSDDALAWRAVFINIAPKILEALRAERWNIVLLSQSVSAAWFPYLPASLARCIYFHDIRSDYLNRSPNRPSEDSLRRLLLEERAAVRNVDAVAFISDLDHTRATGLLAHGPDPATGVVPICVDLDYFSFEPTLANMEPVILFTGHLSHPPNVDAILFFLDSIWPHIVAAVPGARFRIVGLRPSPKIIDATGRITGIELISDVPDIRPYFRSARVYVVPMRFGGGVRQKILEAWALGLPVITTTMGAEGLAAEGNANCWIRDDTIAFADQVIASLRNPSPANVQIAARALVEQHHSPEVSCPRLESLINTATDRRRRSSPRVLFDLRWLEPGKVGGVEQMAHELIDELASFDRSFEYRFYGTRQLRRRWRFSAGFRHKITSSDGLGQRWRIWRDAAIRDLTQSLALPPLTSPELQTLEWYTRLDFTVVHGLPCYVHPDLRQFPSVVTIHDLQHLHLPNLFEPEAIATREREYRESCRLADHVICISDFTRQDVHRRYGVPMEKMTTVWNLPPRMTGTEMTPHAVRRLLRRLGVRPPFLLYPAQPWPHKNHAGLLGAMRLADSSLHEGMKLVMTGRPFPEDHPAIELLRDPAVGRRTMHLGYRSALEIAALYRGAEAMVFPSLFEGFGMPLIEAMQCGCPVVCGEHTSLPEIAGNAAFYADIARPEALAKAIVTVTRDAGLRDRLRQAGIKNLRRFNRRALAEKTRAIYAAVHDRHFG